MAKNLVSACLLGCKVRYNGSDLKPSNNDFDWLIKNHEIVSFCPEVSAGLPIPRVPAEIQCGVGQDVLSGNAKVLDRDGLNLTDKFLLGAQLALEKCKLENIEFAVLTEYSPSCGSNSIYNGDFSAKKKVGNGVTTALLKEYNVQVYNQHQVHILQLALNK